VNKILLPTLIRPWLFPKFQVNEEDEPLFFVNVVVPYDPLKTRYEDREDQFKDALLRYSVQRIEEALRNNGFLSNPPNRVEEIRIRNDDLLLIEKLMQEKRCRYQINEGSNLFCSAGDPDDYNGTSLSPKRVPVSRPICLNCDLPDADYLCSNLIHPAVMSQGGMGAQFGRFVVRALCNLGLDGAEKGPSQCRPGGHRCWEKILEPEVYIPAPLLPPMALPDAFDHLEAVWRNAFGANHKLLHPTTFRAIAQLGQPCTTLDEFESRLSDLAAIFKGMTIPDDILRNDALSLPKDQTFDRMLACERLNMLDEADKQAYKRGVRILRTINKVRNIRQHANKRDLINALSELGISYPPASWGEAWARIRERTTEALTVIRERVRLLS
jgi:hypothetical protein